MNRWFDRMSLGILALLVMAVEARSETIAEDLAAAYLNNPTLLGARASLRSTDEQVPRALSGWRPTVRVTAEFGKADVETETAFFTSEEVRTPATVALTLTQPLYRGGLTVAETRRAEFLVQADRAQFVETEQTVLRQAARAYMNVLREQQVLNLAINNEQVLMRQLQAARDRFEVGEVTRTDVAQAEARVSNAVAERIRRKSDLITARAAYLNATGSLPENLTVPPALAGLPDSELASREIATKESPVILRALFIERAARADIKARMAALLPTIDLNGEISRKEDTSSRGSLTTRKQIIAFRDAVRAAEIALDGVEQEAAVGSRTTLDVLDAEQELFDARVDLVGAERDNVVASYFLQAAIGRLSAVNLGLDVPIYDETRHYNAVRDKAWGYGEVE